jgi:hypothetical protein
VCLSNYYYDFGIEDGRCLCCEHVFQCVSTKAFQQPNYFFLVLYVRYKACLGTWTGLDNHPSEQIEALPAWKQTSARTANESRWGKCRDQPDPKATDLGRQKIAHRSRSLHIDATHHTKSIVRRIRRARNGVASFEIGGIASKSIELRRAER